MPSTPAGQKTLADLNVTVDKLVASTSRFEKAYTLARGQFSEQQSVIAHGVIANGDAIRAIRTEVDALTGSVAKVEAIAVETQSTVTSLDTWMRARFAIEDEEKGKMLREIAGLHSADAASEKRDEAVDAEITKVRRDQEAQKKKLDEAQKKHDEAVARAEQDRARGTMRVGIATALPAAIFAYLKEHPQAPEHAWKAIVALLGGS